MHTVSKVSIPEDEIMSCEVIDPIHQYVYYGVGGGQYTDKVVKFALGSGTNPPFKVGEIVVSEAVAPLKSAVIDIDNGYAYFGSGYKSETSPGYITQIAQFLIS